MHDLDEVLTEYKDPKRDTWVTEVLPRLRITPVQDLVETTGLSRREIFRIRAGNATPRPDAKRALLEWAALAI